MHRTATSRLALAPAGTSPAAVARLNAEIVEVLSAPDVREALLARGAEPHPGTPEQFATFMRAKMGKWAKVVKDANIKAD
jgi:tripartite-type tricarboxylate transporter receptor subunit TctC